MFCCVYLGFYLNFVYLCLHVYFFSSSVLISRVTLTCQFLHMSLVGNNFLSLKGLLLTLCILYFHLSLSSDGVTVLEEPSHVCTPPLTAVHCNADSGRWIFFRQYTVKFAPQTSTHYIRHFNLMLVVTSKFG